MTMWGMMRERERGARPFGTSCLPIFLAGLLVLEATVEGLALSNRDDAIDRYNMLYKVALFVEWPVPPQTGEEFTICAVGHIRTSLLVNTLSRKSIQGHRIVVRLVDGVSNLSACRILFVAASGAPPMERMLAAVGGMPILTVGEAAGFAQGGGMIELGANDDRYAVTINWKAAQRAQLIVSAKLLSLAEIVGS